MYFLTYTQKNGRAVYWTGQELSFIPTNRKEYKEHHHAETALNKITSSRTGKDSYHQLKISWD